MGVGADAAPPAHPRVSARSNWGSGGGWQQRWVKTHQLVVVFVLMVVLLLAVLVLLVLAVLVLAVMLISWWRSRRCIHA